jgi:hypothetical protein
MQRREFLTAAVGMAAAVASASQAFAMLKRLLLAVVLLVSSDIARSHEPQTSIARGAIRVRTY